MSMRRVGKRKMRVDEIWNVNIIVFDGFVVIVRRKELYRLLIFVS